MTRAIYIHIPFCMRRCPYCDFTSRPIESDAKTEYLEALCREIISFDFPFTQAESFFMGGGTPSELTGDEIAQVVRSVEEVVQFRRPTEWTIECNPGTVNPASCDRFLELGFNRISLGVQSFNNLHLQTLGRVHSPKSSLESLEHCRMAGFENINLDLIFGIPGQSLEDWKNDLEKAVELGPEHLSLYNLTIEPGTHFHRQKEQGLISPPDEELAAAMYELAMDLTEAAGYSQYEISNFALPGYECVQNMAYWTNSTYVGFGISAASYVDRTRWTNTEDWEEYLDSARRGAVSRAVEEKLSSRQALGEEIMLRLRTFKGVPIPEVSEKYNISILELFSNEIELLKQQGLLDLERDRMRLSRRGKLLANEVCGEFLS